MENSSIFLLTVTGFSYELEWVDTGSRRALLVGSAGVATALGKMDAWGLLNSTITSDPWDYIHLTTWNFLPFLMMRGGAAPAWVVRLAFLVWGVAGVALVATLLRLRRVLACGNA